MRCCSRVRSATLISRTPPALYSRSYHLIDYCQLFTYVVRYRRIKIYSSNILVYNPRRVETLFVLEAWSYYLNSAGSSINGIRVVYQNEQVHFNEKDLRDLGGTHS